MNNQNNYHPGPQPPTPEERLFLMSDEVWEKFIEECARQLKTEGQYKHVVRMGGAGDKGRDVCGYTADKPKGGTWDLYQAKHYAGTLSPSEFAPELAKFLSCVQNGDYTCPRKYFVCALRVGPSLLDLILNPDKMYKWILNEWKIKKGKFGSNTYNLTSELEKFIQKFQFGIIKNKTPADLLEIHSRSDKHWEQFGILGHREPNPPVPEALDSEEQTYVEALMKVYSESSGSQIGTPSNIPSDLIKHFIFQRRLFYSAEGLNRFSRDKLPGAFNELLDEVELGVGSVVAAPQPDGMTRLKETLSTANTLKVNKNPLNSRLMAGDLQGTCHHLANQERVTWVIEDE